MALHIGAVSIHSSPFLPIVILGSKKHTHFFNPSSSSSSCCSVRVVACDQSKGTGGGVTEEEPPGLTGSLSSSRTQLDLLDQLTSTSSSSTDGYTSDGIGDSFRPKIRDQLAQLVGDTEGEDFSIQLGKKNLKKVSANFLTISQKRNIKRQTYLNTVSQRNDSVFFATIGGFVILPPIIILGVAILVGYVQLFP